MLDLLALASLALAFGLALLYVHSCERLKGVRP